MAGTVAHALFLGQRRELASQAIVNRESPHITRRFLGHLSADTTNCQVHVDEDILREATKRVAFAVQRRVAGIREASLSVPNHLLPMKRQESLKRQKK